MSKFAWYTLQESPSSCELCRRSLPTKDLIIWTDANGSKTHFVCPNCFNSMISCHTCANAVHCGFKADHSAPQIVMKTIQQGMMRMQTQVKNPDLVRKHCMNCICGNGKGECNRDEQGTNCPKWELGI